MKAILHGVVPAIVTPMNQNGDIDTSSLKKQADYLIACGVNGLFVAEQVKAHT